MSSTTSEMVLEELLILKPSHKLEYLFSTKGRILLIADESFQSEQIRASIRKAFPAVLVFIAFSHSIDSFLSEHSVDIVLMSALSMDIDAYKLLLKIRNDFPQSKVLVFTYPVQKNIQNSSHLQLSLQCLEIPFTEESLFSKLNTYLSFDQEEVSMSGQLGSDELADILQLLSLKQQTCSIEVRTELASGELWFERGELIGVQYQNYNFSFSEKTLEEVSYYQDNGSESFFKILNLSRSHFIIRTLSQKSLAKVERNITRSWEFLLLEHARITDEFNQPKVLGEISDPKENLESIQAFLEQSSSFDALLALENTESDPVEQSSERDSVEFPKSNLVESPLPQEITQENNLMSELLSLQKIFPGTIVTMTEEGSVEEFVGDGDGEILAATNSYSLQHIGKVGGLLGLGEVQSFGFSGNKESWLTLQHKEQYICCHGKEQKGQLFGLAAKLLKTLE